jgi:CRP-like cAMP-binding protein
MSTLDEAIAAADVFAGLSAADLELLAGCATHADFAEDQLLFRAGDPADTFFLVRSGRVALELHTVDRGGIVIETIEAGHVVGWSWLFEPYRWHFDARAASAVDTAAFDAASVRAACEQDTALGYELMKRFGQVMIDRLQHTRVRLLDVYGSDNAD